MSTSYVFGTPDPSVAFSNYAPSGPPISQYQTICQALQPLDPSQNCHSFEETEFQRTRAHDRNEIAYTQLLQTNKELKRQLTYKNGQIDMLHDENTKLLKMVQENRALHAPPPPPPPPSSTSASSSTANFGYGPRPAFWHYKAYLGEKAWRNKMMAPQTKAREGTCDGSGRGDSRGKKRCRKLKEADEHRMLWYVEDLEGNPVSAAVIDNIRASSRALWHLMKEKGVAPNCWCEVNFQVGEAFKQEMCVKHPELSYSEGLWKAKQITTDGYSSWKSTYLSKDEDESEPAAKKPRTSNTPELSNFEGLLRLSEEPEEPMLVELPSPVSSETKFYPSIASASKKAGNTTTSKTAAPKAPKPLSSVAAFKNPLASCFNTKSGAAYHAQAPKEIPVDKSSILTQSPAISTQAPGAITPGPTLTPADPQMQESTPMQDPTIDPQVPATPGSMQMPVQPLTQDSIPTQDATINAQVPATHGPTQMPAELQAKMAHIQPQNLTQDQAQSQSQSAVPPAQPQVQAPTVIAKPRKSRKATVGKNKGTVK
ncbi:hypothetical protein BDQ17DRAFT_1338550 [Cyathus striatus]|nr:hypothetical protein BDQ17DRAFT_1338550 [Cyathus striatus]